MIIEKDGQIIVTELRPIGEINDKHEVFLFAIQGENHIYFETTCLYMIEDDCDEPVGFLPRPIYQPQTQEPVYLECGE